MSIRMYQQQAAPPEKEVTLYLRDVLRGVQKFWWLCIVLAAMGSGIVLLVSHRYFVPLYQASATYTVLTPNETLSGDPSAYSFSYSRTTADRVATAFQYTVQSSILHKNVCASLDVPTMPAELSVDFAAGTNMMTVTATGPDPWQTYDVLLAFAAQYHHVTDYIIGPTQLVTISAPVLPTEPCNGQSRQKVAIRAAGVGMLLGGCWILCYAVLRQTVRTKRDIRQTLNQPCMGVHPQVTFRQHRQVGDERVLYTNPAVNGVFGESMRLLRDAVQNGLRENEKVVMVTSTAPREGKSVIALNLAMLFAQTEKNVLLLDADLRHSGLANLLDAEQATAVKVESTDLYQIQRYAAWGIDVLTLDTKAHSIQQLLRTDRIRAIVEPLRTRYDLVLIDTPPCGLISDTASIAHAADVAIYVVRQDMVLTSRIRSGIHMLQTAGIRMLGCVLNGAAGGGSYGYYGHYGNRKRGSCKSKY